MNGIPDDRRRIVIGAAVVVGLAGLLFGGWVWWQARTQVSTDDAYVEGAVTVISSKVSGNISEMLVKDNQAVKAGEVLLRVDPRDYRAKRDQTAAAVKVAEAALLALRSELPMTRGVTMAQGDEARGALEGARAAEAASQSAVEEAQAQLEAKRAAASAAPAGVAGGRARGPPRSRPSVRRSASASSSSRGCSPSATMTRPRPPRAQRAPRSKRSSAARSRSSVRRSRSRPRSPPGGSASSRRGSAWPSCAARSHAPRASGTRDRSRRPRGRAPGGRRAR